MNARDAIRLSIATAEMVVQPYLADLSDADLMRRAAPGINHINWQVGHLIAAEHEMIAGVAPDAMPALPAGFVEKYGKATATSDDASQFLTKDELLKIAAEQRAGTLKALDAQTDESLDKATGIEYAPTVGALFSLQGAHWLMHAGQWAVVRRQLGRAPLF